MSVDFALELLKKSKAEGLNTAMETSGFASSEQYLKVLPYVDEFLWDYKETDQKSIRNLRESQKISVSDGCSKKSMRFHMSG